MLLILFLLAIPAQAKTTSFVPSRLGFEATNPAPAPEWTLQERRAWKQILDAKEANFGPPDEQCRASANTASATVLTERFLLDILTNPKFSEAVPHQVIRIVGARFDDYVDLSDVHFARPLRLEKAVFGRGLSLDYAKIDGLVSFEGSHFVGSVDMRRLEVGQSLLLKNACFREKVAMKGVKIGSTLEIDNTIFEDDLDVGGLEVKQTLYIRDHSVFFGIVKLLDADIDDSVDIQRSHFWKGVNLHGSNIGRNIQLIESHFYDGLQLSEVKIKSSLEAYDVTVDSCMYMEKVDVGLSLVLRNSQFSGDIALRGSKVNSALDFGGTEFDVLRSAEFHTVNAETFCRLRLAETDRQQPRTGYGLVVDLTGSKVGGELRLGSFEPEREPPRWRRARLILRNASVGTIQDRFPEGTTEFFKEPDCQREGQHAYTWPEKDLLELDGLTYERLGRSQGGQWSGMMDRPSAWFKCWLDLSPSDSPQPYRQLAGLFRQAGADEKADDILYAGRERERDAEDASWPRRMRLALLNVTVGYGIGLGYFRALSWFGWFTLIGTGVLMYGRSSNLVAPRDPTSGGLVERCSSCVSFGLLAGVLISTFMFGYCLVNLPFSFSAISLVFLVLGAIVIIVQYKGLLENATSSSSPGEPLDRVPVAVFYSVHQLLPIIQLDKAYDDDVRLGGCVRWYFYIHKLVGWVLGSFLLAALAGLTQGR